MATEAGVIKGQLGQDDFFFLFVNAATCYTAHAQLGASADKKSWFVESLDVHF